MSGGILKIGKLRHAFADGATTRGGYGQMDVTPGFCGLERDLIVFDGRFMVERKVPGKFRASEFWVCFCQPGRNRWCYGALRPRKDFVLLIQSSFKA